MNQWFFYISLSSLVFGVMIHSEQPTTGAKKPQLSQEVIWMAPFFSRSGYGSEALSFVLALFKRAPGLHIQQHGDTYDQRIFEGFPTLDQQMMLKMMYPPRGKKVISICHSEPGAWFPSKWPTSKCPHDNSYYSIGRTMFETDRLPTGWADRCNKMDEIWVPTKFHEQIFIEAGVTSKVVVVPEPVDADFFNPKLYAPLELEGENIEYKFLSIFKWENRKGWNMLLRAFFRSFQKSQNVALYILTHDYHEEGDQVGSLQDILQTEIALGSTSLETVPPIYFIKEHIPTTDLPRLYKAADAFVLPSRGEGWGRPHVEAMSMELPLISTFWSGPTEFMTEENSYPLKITGLTPVGTGAFSSHKWAEPDVDHLSFLMKHVFRNREEAKMKGKQARVDMINNYHPDVVADIVVKQLAKIPKPETHTEL